MRIAITLAVVEMVHHDYVSEHNWLSRSGEWSFQLTAENVLLPNCFRCLAIPTTTKHSDPIKANPTFKWSSVVKLDIVFSVSLDRIEWATWSETRMKKETGKSFGLNHSCDYTNITLLERFSYHSVILESSIWLSSEVGLSVRPLSSNCSWRRFQCQ